MIELLGNLSLEAIRRFHRWRVTQVMARRWSKRGWVHYRDSPTARADRHAAAMRGDNATELARLQNPYLNNAQNACQGNGLQQYHGALHAFGQRQGGPMYVCKDYDEYRSFLWG